MFHQRKQHTIYFAKTHKRPKNSCRVFLSPKKEWKEWKKVKASEKMMKNTKTFTKKRNNDMKRRYRDIKKIILMRLRLLTFTKGVTRRLGRFHSLKKHYPNQMSLKRHQSPLMIQARKKRRLKKHRGLAMEKRPLQRQEKKFKRPHSLKKYQSHPNLLTQAKSLKKKKDCLKVIKEKKYLLCWE